MSESVAQRKLTPSRSAMEHVRKLAVQRVLAGEKQADVARSMKVRPNAVYRWMRKARAGGLEALVARKATGRRPTLSLAQERRLFKLLAEKSPRQLKFPFALWTLPLVGQLVERLFRIVLHKATLGRLLRRLGFSPQVPRQRAFQRDDAACEEWRRKTFPRILAEARKGRGIVLFLDECGVHELGPIARTWALRGNRPVIRTSGSRRKINVISAISPRGRLWFRCFRGNLNSSRFVGFLQELLQEVQGKILLVLDRHPAHVSAMTKRFLLVSPRLTIHLLPSYAPDLNADEHVWGVLKGTFRRKPLSPGENLDTVVAERMATIAADRRLLRKVLHHPELGYMRDALRA